MTHATTFALAVAAAYIAGSINFSILAFRLSGRDDPRRHGSNNPGATNVYRQAGIGWAAAVLCLDVGRAAGVGWAATALLDGWQVPWVGLGLIVGNRFPCFHDFRGGKGVANYLGFTAVVAPVWAALGGLVWAAVHLVGRTPFLSSFAMLTVLAAGSAVATDGDLKGAAGVAATLLFIVACHHRNIRDRWGT
jgi:glycerol-3-phosphate acyltransferase PlsY